MPRDTTHAMSVQEGVESTHGKTWCRIRGPLSGLNNPGLSTYVIDFATMMDVSSFVRD